VVVADASKIGRATVARICDASAVHELITDDAADSAVLDALRAAGVGVTVV
jgi:DeoR family transcriptional regulator, aga operon transcriptional repressor